MIQKLASRSSISDLGGIWHLRVFRGFCAVAAAALLAAPVFAQTYIYYPVNPTGAPYGSTYTGSPLESDQGMLFLQRVLQAGVPTPDPAISLQFPLPTGKRVPTPTELATATYYAARSIVSGNNPPLNGGVTPGSLSISAFASDVLVIKPADSAVMISALAQGVVDSEGSVTTQDKVSRLTQVVGTLASAQPANTNSNVSLVLAVAAAGVDPSLPKAIPRLVASAISKIPDDAAQITSLILSGVSNVAASTLDQDAKSALILKTYISTLMKSASATNNPVIVDAMVRSLTDSSTLGLVTTSSGGISSLGQVLQAALKYIPTRDKFEVGAVATGALRTLGATAAADIQSYMSAALAGSAAQQAYADAVVSGYLSTAQGYAALVSGNANADAIAAGAIVRGDVTTRNAIQGALASGAANARDVIFAAVSADSDSAVSIAQAAITTSYLPAGTATFTDIVQGAVSAVPQNSQIRDIVDGLLRRTASSLTALPTAAVLEIVEGAIAAAYSTGKDGAFSAIVAKAAALGKNTPGVNSQMVTAAIQAINTATAGDTRYPTSQDRPTYVAVVAALASSVDPVDRDDIRAAVLGGGGSLAAVGGDVVAAQLGSDMVEAIRTSSATVYTAILKQLDNARLSASPNSGAVAGLYAASIAGSAHLSAALAAAIKQSTVAPATLLSAANNASNYGSVAALQMVSNVAARAKKYPSQVLDYVGIQIVNNPSLTKDIAIAWTVVDPGHAHFVSHAVAFNNPTAASTAVSSIFTYAQITNAQPFVFGSSSNPTGAKATGIIDQPAAAAAIVAGFSTGILEANLSEPDRKNAFVSMITAAISSSIKQNGTYLRGPTKPFTNPADAALTFRQSNGTDPFGSDPINPSSAVRTVGAAGAITGYMAQVVRAGDSSLLQAGESGAWEDSITASVLRAAALNGSNYLLEIAQAAAQAFGWISGNSAGAIADTIALQIAQAMLPSGTLDGRTQAELQNAARFGLAEAAAGRIGAGALGLGSSAANVKATGNANNQFYRHRSATGAPVTDIFNL